MIRELIKSATELGDETLPFQPRDGGGGAGQPRSCCRWYR